MKFEEYIDTEKSFLHDISNHLVVLDSIARYLKSHEMVENDVFTEKDKDKIEKLTVTVNKIISRVQDRKSVVLAELT